MRRPGETRLGNGVCPDDQSRFVQQRGRRSKHQRTNPTPRVKQDRLISFRILDAEPARGWPSLPFSSGMPEAWPQAERRELWNGPPDYGDARRLARGLYIPEVSRRLRLPKSSAHVIVLTLERLGYVQKRAGTLHCSLGLKAYALCHSDGQERLVIRTRTAAYARASDPSLGSTHHSRRRPGRVHPENGATWSQDRYIFRTVYGPPLQ
jgi:hypothetical protein